MGYQKKDIEEIQERQQNFSFMVCFLYDSDLCAYPSQFLYVFLYWESPFRTASANAGE